MCDIKKLVVRSDFRLGTAYLIFGGGLAITIILTMSNLDDSFAQFIPAILGIIGGFVWLQYEWHLIFKNKLRLLD
jgi:hypothetical protein